MAILDSFFAKVFNEEYIGTAEQAEGYTSGNLDLLLQQARRNKTVHENRLFDYMQVENDPHYSRNSSLNSKFLNKVTSKVSILSQMVTVLNSTISIMGIKEFIPANINALLFNFNSLADTGVNALGNIKQLVSFKQIENAFLSDLSLQIGNQTITFDQLALMADNVINNVNTFNSVENDGIRPFLSLGIQQFLPDDMQAVFDDAEFLDMLTGLFGDQSPNINLLQSLFKDNTATYSQVKISEIVVDTTPYTANLTLDDPFGFNTQAQFQSELSNQYNTNIGLMVSSATSTVPMTDEEINTISNFLIDDAQSNIDKAFEGSAGLPSLVAVNNGVVSESNNKALAAISNSFEIIGKNTLQSLGLTQPVSGISTIDHLQNIKRNLKARIEMNKFGATSASFIEIDRFLKTCIIDQDLTTSKLIELNTALLEITNEKI